MKKTILTICLMSAILSSCFVLPKSAQKSILRPVKSYPVENQKGNRIVSICVVAFFAGFVYLYGIRK